MSRKAQGSAREQWVSQDRNFDDIAEKFSHNIYGTTKGDIRQAVLWHDLSTLLTQLPQRSLRILDAGGGEGLMARQLAEMGHQVVLCDISSEMLMRARVAADKKGVSQSIRFVHCSAQEIMQHLEHPVDLILFHAVLEWIADPQPALSALCRCLSPQGVLSLMFFNVNALLLRNMILGNWGYINAGMPKRKRLSLVPSHPLDPVQVYDWLEDMGMTLLGKTGIRVFHDYLHNKRQQQDIAELLVLEQRYCRQEPFVSLGRYIHVMAKKLDQKDRL